MLENTAFLFADAGPSQVIAFVIYATCTVGFIAWLIYLVRE
ncbi:hypothetical protein [Bradyrhizobium sp. sBnM-33]|nr:hypothetical protein [Bradyrhizobium sp. sBnM-33]WOH47535.1 hypothetical protein RX328_25515 [Bradyrhizobium sp. sBnM-33]